MESEKRSKVFDYRALRLLVGLIALFIPFVVSLVASERLTSISASYYTEARDLFVGMLFIVGAFLWAYNGHFRRQAVASKIGSMAALCVALFPTAWEPCSSSATSKIHYIAALLLFLILIYFCLVAFRKKIKGLGGKKGRRNLIYLVCGNIMIVAMLSILVAKVFMDCDLIARFRIVYWAEAVALISFGIAWIVAGKCIPALVDEEDALKIFNLSKTKQTNPD